MKPLLPSSPILPISSAALEPKEKPLVVEYKMVEVAAYAQSITAELVKSRLQSEGLEVRLVNNDIASDLFSMAAGGIKVQVREPDLKSALEILASIDAQNEDEEAAEEHYDEKALLLSQKKSESSLAQKAWRSSILTPIFPPLILWSAWLLTRSFVLEDKLRATWQRSAAVALNGVYFALLAYAARSFL